MEKELVSTKDIAEMLSMTVQMTRMFVNKEKGFPKPIMISPKIRRWKHKEVVEWINKR